MKITPSLLIAALGLGLASAAAIFNSPAHADQIWAQRYDGPGHGDDFPYAVLTDGAGNAIVTGISRNQNGNDDFYTAKYAAGDGSLLWDTPTMDPSAETIGVPVSPSTVRAT